MVKKVVAVNERDPGFANGSLVCVKKGKRIIALSLATACYEMANGAVLVSPQGTRIAETQATIRTPHNARQTLTCRVLDPGAQYATVFWLDMLKSESAHLAIVRKVISTATQH